MHSIELEWRFKAIRMHILVIFLYNIDISQAFELLLFLRLFEG